LSTQRAVVSRDTIFDFELVPDATAEEREVPMARGDQWRSV
jgi:hypothetical protein